MIKYFKPTIVVNYKKMVNNLTKLSKYAGLQIVIKKTKVIRYSAEITIKLNGEALENVLIYIYINRYISGTKRVRKSEEGLQ